jgi:hypothetical protein
MRNVVLACVQLCVFLGGLSIGGVKAEALEIPLYKYQTESKSLRMANQFGSASLSIPLSQRMNLKQAKLHLVYSNSIGLLKNRSSLTVAVNGTTVKQFTLDPLQPDSASDIALPVSLFKVGYNELSFSVIQHYTDGSCEDQLAPELWSEIDAAKSTISFDGELHRVKPVLSDLEHYFDPKLGNYSNLNVLSMQAGATDVKHLIWANLAAQGVAARLKYVPLAVHYAVAQPSVGQAGYFPGLNHAGLSGSDSVLVGTAAELSSLLSVEVKAAIKGAFLGVYPLDEESGRVVVIISGQSDEEVGRAAQTFAHSMASMPDAQSMLVQSFTAPQWNPYEAKGVLQNDEKYTFKRLGLDTQTFKGYYAKSSFLNFSIPSDVYMNEHKGIKLALNLNYGAGFRQDSVVNVLLNHIFVTAIHLDAPNGGDLRNYEVLLPARSLLPGKNLVEIQPQMTPSVTGNCTLLQDRNLLLTLNGDSELRMPKTEHYARMPDMSLLSKSGFPYSVVPNGADTQIWLPNVSPDTVSAALTLLARMMQQTGVPLSAVSFLTTGQPDASRNLIVVSDVRSLPALLNGKAPYPFENGSFATMDSTQFLQPSPAAVVGLGEVGTTLNVAEGPGDHPVSVLKGNATMGDTALMMQFESPLTAGKTVVVLTAQTGELLAQRTDALVTPEFWDGISGNVYKWQETQKSIFLDSVGASYHIGEISIVSRLDFYFSHYPWLWTVVSLLILLMFVLVVRSLVMSYRAKHHNEIAS